MYNITNITNANNIYTMIKATNDLSSGLFMTTFLIVLFFTFLIVFKKQDFKKVLLGDSFFMLVITTLFWAVGLVGLVAPTICLIIMIAMIVAYMITD